MNIIDVSDGVKLCFIPTEKFKTNLITVNLEVPLKKETASSNSLISMVLKRGTKSFSSLTDINKELEDMYGASLYTGVKKKGDVQIISFAIEFLDKSAINSGEDLNERSITLLSEILFSPDLENGVFKKEFVESEKRNLIDLINSRINDKRSYAISRCFEEMCKDEAYGIYEYGDVKLVAEITPESLYKAYLNLIKTSEITVFCIGRYNEPNFTEKIKSMFNLNRDPITLKNEVIKKADKIKEVNEKIDVEQAKLSLGFRTGVTINDGNTAALSLFNTIYGGSPNSKLFENVREKLSLCYYCSSRIEKHKGLMIVYSGIESKNKEKAEHEILNQLEIIKKGEISDSEFDAAKKSLIDAYKSASDSMPSMEDWYVGQLLAGKAVSLEEEAKEVEKVTKDEIIEISKNVTLDTVYLLSSKASDGKEE